MSAAVLFTVALALLCVAVVGLVVHARRGTRLVAGLRADLDAHTTAFARGLAESNKLHSQARESLTHVADRAAGAQHLGLQALDRLLFYTKHSAIMTRLGSKYDQALAKLRADAAIANAVKADAPVEVSADAPQDAAPSQPADVAVAETSAPETTDDDMAKIAGSIGPAATPQGIPCD